MSLVLLFHYLLLNMFRMLVHPSSGACDLLRIYFMCCIALVRCVLVLRCGSAGVVWYPYAGFSLHKEQLNQNVKWPGMKGTLVASFLDPSGRNNIRYFIVPYMNSMVQLFNTSLFYSTPSTIICLYWCGTNRTRRYRQRLFSYVIDGNCLEYKYSVASQICVISPIS